MAATEMMELSDLEREEMLAKKKKMIMKKRKAEFLDKGVKTALLGIIEQKVQSACMSTDHLLVQKRTKLRELLLAEEVAYTTEYVTLCQQANINREEELRSKAIELEAKAERERQQLAAEKLMEKKILSCDTTRTSRLKKQLMELKQDQLWQIREKYSMQEAKREEDRMYHDLMIKNMISMKEHDEENARLLWKKQKDAQKAFMEQMKWKEQKEEKERQLKEHERLQVEEEIRLAKEEEAKEKREERQKKEKTIIEMRELLEKDRAIKERRRREEEEIERTFNELLRAEEEKEKLKKSSDKERLRREMDVFLNKSRELRLLKEEEEKKFDQILMELNEKKQKQKDAERMRLKAAREELFHTVLKQREAQIKEKRDKERAEIERERAEIELLTLQLEQQDKIREEYERRCAEQREKYRCQLLQQMEEVEREKKRKKEEEAEFFRRQKEEEEREIEEVNRRLENLPLSKTAHPMKVVMTNPPKYPCLYPYLK